jgi:putative selenate reductase
LKALAEQTESIEVKTVIDLLALKQIADDAVNGKEYHKEKREINSIKVPLQLPVTDCYMAPCTAACPVHQDVADYISLVQQGRETEALALILDKNALPHITGFICDHQCMYHCTRWDYDEPVLIRDIKKHAALTAYDDLITQLNSIKKANGNTIKAAVIGAGPSGLSAAYYLAVNGFDVTVFEKEKTAGGIIRNVIPQFRIPEEVIEKDIDLIRQVGVDFYFGVNPNFSIETLKADGFKYIYVAIGAGKANELELDPCDSQVRNAIPFLREFHGDPNIELGRRVAIVGGGNSAMDAARAALRCKGVEKVYILYRRTKEQMPADKEEYDLAIADGVEFRELLLPVSHTNGIALCQKMRLGTAGPDGRRNVEAIPDDFISIEINTIIAAIGEKVDERLLNANNIHKLDRSLGATNLENVYIGGDAKRGPSTVIESAADGRNIAKLITEKESQVFQTLLQKYPELNSEARIKNSLQKKSKLDHQRQNIIDETDRCLTCHLICNKCVEVCPNRANLALTINDDAAYFKDAFQIIHFDDLCNECGNCATFCPYEGAPYKEKFTIFSSIELMKDSHNSGFSINHEKNLLSVRLHRSAEILQYQLNDGWEKKLEEKADGGKFSAMIKSIQKRYQYQL